MKSTFVNITGALLFAGISLAASISNKPTFSKDVAPILYKSCVQCHRAGEAGPMAFTSYKEARPWAAAIKQAVATRTMPPWHADPKINHFVNDRRLSDDEVATIVKWAETGAVEGNPAQMPKLPKLAEGWQFGKPDFTITTGAPFNIPASGAIPYKYYTVDPGFKEDTWVQAVEVRPSQRTQVHHILVFVLEEGNVRPTRGGEQYWRLGDDSATLRVGCQSSGSRIRLRWRQLRWLRPCSAVVNPRVLGYKGERGPWCVNLHVLYFCSCPRFRSRRRMPRW